MQTALVILFWLSLVSIFYSYLGYPILGFVASQLYPSKRRWQVHAIEANLPEVTVLIAAYNAEQHIRQRINNLLACDYPAGRLRIVVASDGSTDATVDIVRSFNDPLIQAFAFQQRRGKAMTLVAAVHRLSSEVIVFTDATTRFETDSVGQLVRHFADPQVGLVTGKVSIVDEQGTPSESLYWRSEMMVKRSEAKLGIMLGASGAIYAIRRKLFVVPSRPIINDDLVLPMLAHIRHRCGFVFDETAKAYALSSGGLAGEFRRRCRIGTGAFQCLPVLGELAQRRNARQAFAFCSHKLLRWICPFLLVALIVTNVALISSPPYRSFLWLQAAAYLMAVVGMLAPQRGRMAGVARAASTFLVMNLALLVGFFRWVINPGNVIWMPTPRPIVGPDTAVAGRPLKDGVRREEIAA